MMKKIILCVLINLFLSSMAYADSFTASVNRNPIPVGEAFVLNLKYEGNPDGEEPALETLKQQFQVFSVSQSTQSRYINGHSSQMVQWNLGMAVDEVGEYTIPPIKIGKYQSQPLKIKIVEGSATDNFDTSQPRFSAQRTISNAHPLVQQQINYTFKISTTEALQGDMPQFLMTNDDWIIRSLGNPILENRIKDGIEIRDYIFNYALFPQKSGELIIPKLQFNGSYVDEDARPDNRFGSVFSTFNDLQNMGFGAFGIRRPVTLSSAPISIQVGKIPTENNGYWWIPAKKAELSSDWQKQIPEFKSGEAVNREIYLKVVGVINTQMPKIKFKDIEGVKQYPEKPEIKSLIEGDDVVSTMKVNMVYIPEKSGNITIPEVAVNWYNVNTQKMEKTLLPAVKVNVKQGAVKEVPQAEMIPQVSEPIKTASPKNPTLPQPQKPVWPYILSAFAAGILLSALVAWVSVKYMFRTQTKVIPSETEKKVSVAKAVRENDLRSIRDNVLNWARKQYPEKDIKNFDDVADIVNNVEFTRQLQLLQKALYGGATEDFNPIKFMDIFSHVSKQQKTKAKKKIKILPDLYQK